MNIPLGSFGVVYKVKNKQTGKLYALKKIKKNNIEGLSLIKKEIKIMYSIDHKNIVKLYNHFEDQTAVYLMIELCSKGDIYTKLNKSPNKRLEENKAKYYIKQLIEGL